MRDVSMSLIAIAITACGTARPATEPAAPARSAPVAADDEHVPDQEAPDASDRESATGSAAGAGIRAPGPGLAAEPQSLASALADARKAALGLAGAGWTEERAAMVAVLHALAALVASADCSGTSGPAISEIRLQAEMVSRAQVPYHDGGRIKAAIDQSLDVLERIPIEAPERMEAWTVSARSATERIEGESSLTFQRAIIQDGLRATIDAFGAASLLGLGCS